MPQSARRVIDSSRDRYRPPWRTLVLFLPVFALLPLHGCLAASVASRGAPESAIQDMVFELPPIDLPAGSGHVLTVPAYQTVPVGGWFHGFDVEVVDAAGNPLPAELLHHAQILMPGKRELLNPEMLRLVGAGSETGAHSLPPQAGVRVEQGDTLLLTSMLTNPTGQNYEGVRVRVHFKFTGAGPWRDPLSVHPFFAHVTPPLENTSYDLPPGESERTLELEFPIPGKILALGGHLHEYGVSLSIEDEESGKVLWEALAEKDANGTVEEIPDDIFLWSGGIPVEPDHAYRFVVRYDNPGALIPDGGMGTVGGVFLADAEWPAADPDDPIYQWDLERMSDGEVHGMEGMEGMDHMHEAESE
jgi:hypothetical protein